MSLPDSSYHALADRATCEALGQRTSPLVSRDASSISQGTELVPGTLLTSSEEIPTVTDNLYNNGVISEWSLGISFAPTTSEEVQNGVLTFGALTASFLSVCVLTSPIGGVDDSLYTGDLNILCVSNTSTLDLIADVAPLLAAPRRPRNRRPTTGVRPSGASVYLRLTAFPGYDQTVSYGGQEILSLTAGITDTGTTLLYLATDAYDAYVDATGATLDSATGLLSISASQFDALESLFFDINGVRSSFTNVSSTTHTSAPIRRSPTSSSLTPSCGRRR